MINATDILEKLNKEHSLSLAEYECLIENINPDIMEKAAEYARVYQKQYYGNKVFTRGLVEFTNFCRNNCYYCGIRRDNGQCERYRLSKEDILECANAGYELGFRTVVLQGGEDFAYSDESICEIVSAIKKAHPDVAVTLSIGERSRESYEAYFKAGASRYLLRHETANPVHYGRLHPKEMSFEHRMNCLRELREIGYQVGAGFMVQSPGQTAHDLAMDLKFIEEFKPDMCGIGPFISHKQTPFAKEESGTLEMTLFLLSLIRIIYPQVLLPATTALGTIDPCGREKGLQAGANVVMPNLSPTSVRKMYTLYDNKICTGEEAAECRGCLQRRVASVGYEIVEDIGDRVGFK
ncbi:[FeFe] hydrogenase H-cluster radical SAM maturase HydE [Pseudobutyrivibrio xylanivorans]|uniref:[FeFe] hydrogenase H-cluster radical SAM maturase HydE n=1 Tax=Pseudobutyrivibrio xylanivorans TaxID=185007 RepID=A0A5P6VSM5_PSEXY|nr:[FeFe] hydrogenase H-cluster radical SAM maturase HydE [Pseudobutyrivibrio xylanivorans]QFJ53851.1 [FeFe] hydrogenase H-cluster radical SAM maturase HydE [Pseudobutyrivibrio xylanivorans]